MQKTNNKKVSVAVLMGGISSERKISLWSGKEVVEALRSLNKYQVTVYDPKYDLTKIIADKDKIDVAFPVFHGRFGEDGTIQGFLELLKIHYVGSWVLASSLAMDKLKSYEIFQDHNLATPKIYAVLNDEDFKIETEVCFPTVVKPNREGSSIGVSICQNEPELEKGIKLAFQYQPPVIVEEFIFGTEITAGVLGNKSLQTLPVVEIVPTKEFFNYQAKYDGTTSEIVPARISKEHTETAQKYARLAHQVLGCEGFSRTDMILDKNGKIFVLETNTIPGLTPESLYPKAASAAGIEFPQLLDKLIQLALEK